MNPAASVPVPVVESNRLGSSFFPRFAAFLLAGVGTVRFCSSSVSILSAFRLKATCGAAKFFADKLPRTVVLPKLAAKLSKLTEFSENVTLAVVIAKGFFNCGAVNFISARFAVPE